MTITIYLLVKMKTGASYKKSFFFPFISCPQAEHLTSCYWGGSSNPTERHDPSLPYLEQYRIDVEQFKGLFNVLFSWANGAHSDPLAARFFRLLDENGDALINFREFISGLGESSRTESLSSSITMLLKGLNEKLPVVFQVCCVTGI